MALTIPNYLQPGAYSTIIPNPTTTTASGPPIVAIIGQGLRGSYNPQLFFSPTDSQNAYGYATKSNPLSLGMQIAFENGAPQVIGLNVAPENSTPSDLIISLTSLPVTAYIPAPTSAIDAVTQLPVNTTGNVAGTFYVQDYNPVVADPVLNSSPQATQQAFSLAGNTSLLQYEKLLGFTFVPLANTQMAQVIVYTVPTTTSPVTSVTQSQWNQYLNGFAIAQAFEGTYLTPALAEIVVADSSQTDYNPTPGYRELNSCVGLTLNKGTGSQITISNINQAYAYAFNGGSGSLFLGALQPGTQHQILMGLFDSNLASQSSTNTQALGLPVQNGAVNNPFLVLDPGTDGVVTIQSYLNAITQLDAVRADVIVVMYPDTGIQLALLDDVTTQSSTPYANERIAIISGPISEQYTTTISNVTALQGSPGSQRMVYIWPTAGFRFDPILNTIVALDGTYLAAACAGILCSNSPSTPLTHKVITGFNDISVHVNNQVANSIAQYGICIIENNPQFGIRVRDGITCDPTSPETQEISVVRQLDFTAQSLRDIMNASVVATAITQNTLGVVQSLATTVLQNLENNNQIFGYKNVVARIDPNDPRQIDLSVAVRPAYPCKYVQITIQVTSSLAGLS